MNCKLRVVMLVLASSALPPMAACAGGATATATGGSATAAAGGSASAGGGTATATGGSPSTTIDPSVSLPPGALPH